MSVPQEHAGTHWNPVERVERARKNERLLIKRAREVGQENIAQFAGISDSTISAWFQKNSEAMGKALAYMGLKVLPASAACVESADKLNHLLYWAKIGMDSVKSAEDLLFADPE